MMQTQTQVLFLSHGGGPMPLLGNKEHYDMVACLQNIAAQLRKPSAIIIISAHWEETVPTITSGANPSLMYDYSGFPEESYHIQYPCKGEPALAQQIYTHLESAGISAKLDEERGFDHGVFVPLKIMFPAADIPCVQLSLLHSLDAAEHIRVGKALQGLDNENLLIIGSGFSFHNMRAFFAPNNSDAQANNVAFEHWLIDTCSNTKIDETERAQRLRQWEKAPGARFCHPREEHLLPLHVCYGVAQRACSQYFEVNILNKQSSMYFWS